MTTTALQPENQERQYGNWRRHVLTGLGKIPLWPLMVIFAETIVTLLFLLVFRQVWGIVLGGLVILATIVLVWFRDEHELTYADKIQERVMFKFRKATGRNEYSAGLTGVEPSGRTKIPGLGSTIELYEGTDVYGRPFGILFYPRSKQWQVRFECYPNAGGLHDKGKVDQFVANWGGLGARFCRDAGVVQYTVTGDTAPDWGGKALQAVRHMLSSDGPAIAREAVEQSASRKKDRAPRTSTYMTVTFKTSRRADDKVTELEHMTAELARRVVAITTSMADTGAGTVEPMTAREICEYVKAAYDPELARVIDEANLEGAPVRLKWSDVGPNYAKDIETAYIHNGAVSQTWEMSVAPRGTVSHKVLADLLAPHERIERKRVTLVYRPIDSARAVDLVEHDVRQATLAYDRGKGTVRAETDLERALVTSKEESTGAGLIDFGMIITATTLDPDRVDDVKAVIEQSLSSNAHILVRPVWGKQDTAFLMGLLGIDVRAHSFLSAQLAKKTK